MDMEQKNKFIKEYIINISKKVNSQYNGLIDDEKIFRAIEMFKNSSDDLETEIIPKINKLVQEVIDNYLKQKEQEKIMLKNIEKNINSDLFIEMLKRNWNKFHNIGYISDLIGELYIHHMINKNGYGFEFYITQIETLYLQYKERKISPEHFEKEKAKLISLVIANKLEIDVNKEITQDDMLKIKNYFLNEYVVNGYVTHSFPEAYYESVMKNGLVSEINKRDDKPIEVQEIQEIFMNKGVVAPMGGYPYYGGSGIYYEHDFTKMFRHAVDSPEWFNWFTSSDHTTAYHDDIRKSPYVLRNEQSCRINVCDLCKNAGLNEKETDKVLKFYEEQYNKFSSPKLNVALISKNFLGKDNVSKVVPQNLDLLNTITYVLNDGAKQYTEHNGNVYIGVIPSDKLNVTVIPSANNYINNDNYSRESKENLTNIESNLAILKNAENNKNRLVSAMIPKVEQVKKELLSKTNQSNNKISDYQKEDRKIVSFQKKAFDQRSQTEIQTYNRIKSKNQFIKKQKRQKKELNKPKVKSLTNLSSKNDPFNNKGFMNVIMLSLIVCFIASVLCMMIYLVII